MIPKSGYRFSEKIMLQQCVRLVGADACAPVVGAAGFEPATWSTQNSRATRLRYAPPGAAGGPSARASAYTLRATPASKAIRAQRGPNQWLTRAAQTLTRCERHVARIQCSEPSQELTEAARAIRVAARIHQKGTCASRFPTSAPPAFTISEMKMSACFAA
jgi:hypothetical protein